MGKKESTQLKDKKNKKQNQWDEKTQLYPNNAANWSKDAKLFTTNNIYNAQGKKEFAKKCLGNC